MKRFLLRLLAYITAGLSLGAAVRFAVFDGAMAGGMLAYAVMAIALGGMGGAVWLLVRASAGIPQGIRINPPWTVVAMDAVCIIAAALAVFFIIDGYAERFLGLARGLADPLAADVIAFMFLPSALVLALVVTNSGSQSIGINADGLVVSGSFGTQSVAWDKIEKLTPDEEYVVVSRVGVPMPRHLRTNLEIITVDEESLTVYQPGLKSTAKHVLKQISKHAPPRLLQNISEIEAAWL